MRKGMNGLALQVQEVLRARSVLAVTSSSSAASAAIARHSASLGSEAGQAEQAFVQRRQGFRRPPLGDFLEAYPKLRR